MSRSELGSSYWGTGVWSKEYHSQDVLGSTVMVTDEWGRQKGSYGYDVYGVLVEGSLMLGNEIGYTGKRHDAVTGAYDYGFRDYTPMVGRFTTVDPIRSGGNWYAYVNGDPVNLVDPWGLKTVYINLPDETSKALEKHLAEKGYASPLDAPELASILQSLPEDTTEVVFAGAHGGGGTPADPAEMGGIRAEELAREEIDLDDAIQLYLYTCNQGFPEKVEAWAKAVGLPEENVHGVAGVSYTTTTYAAVLENEILGIAPSVEFALKSAADAVLRFLGGEGEVEAATAEDKKNE